MLKHLHNKKIQKKIWIILAVLILPAFVFWGTGSIMRSSREQNYVGIISGRKISNLRYQDALKATRNQALMLFGDNFYKLEEQLDLRNQAWDRLLLLEETKRRRIKVSDDEVKEAVAGYGFFQKNSKFDIETYERILRFMFYTPAREFEEQTRENLAIRKLFEEITRDTIVSEDEIKNAYKKEKEEARVAYLTALFNDYYDPDIKLEENELEDYFKNHSLEFKRPETFNLEYIELLYPQESKQSEINLIDDQARSLYLQLRSKKDLSATAQDAGLESKETGLFNLNDPIPGIGWSAEIISALTKLKINQEALPIHTQKGWYFIKLKERKDPYIPDFPEAKEEIKEKIVRLKAEETAKEKIESAFSNIQDTQKTKPESINFDKLSAKFDLQTGETEFFKRASYIPGIGISDKFFDIVSGLKVNQVSMILEMDQGYYIVKLIDWKGINEELYLKEKGEFSKQLLEVKKQNAFAQFIQRLRKEANLLININQQQKYNYYK